MYEAEARIWFCSGACEAEHIEFARIHRDEPNPFHCGDECANCGMHVSDFLGPDEDLELERPTKEAVNE